MKKYLLLVPIFLLASCGITKSNEARRNDSSTDMENVTVSTSNTENVNDLSFYQESDCVTIKNNLEVDALLFNDETLLEESDDSGWKLVNITMGLTTMTTQLSKGSDYVYYLPADLSHKRLRVTFFYEVMGQGKKSKEIYFD